MKITKTQLKQIIEEELEAALNESQWQDNIDSYESELRPGTKVRKRKTAADVVAPEGRIVGRPEEQGSELIYKVRWTKHGRGQPARVPASALEPI